MSAPCLADPGGFVDDVVPAVALIPGSGTYRTPPVGAVEAVEAWLDVDPTERCMRAVRCHREWWAVLYVLGDEVASGFGRTLDAAMADLGSDLWRVTGGDLR